MLLIFDWDGTLADSESHIVHALQQAGDTLGLPERAHRDCASLIGLGLADAARKLHPQLQPVQVSAFCKAYSERFMALESAGYALRLFDGVDVLLEKLLNDGHELAIATGKSRRGLDRALANAGLAKLFSATRTADESASKPDPAMLRDLLRYMDSKADEAVMIGDTSYDMQMAQALGMRRVAATYGVHEEKILQRYSPDWLIDKPPALLNWPMLQGPVL
ncbi:MAG: HAD-IA family hydrolase [Pseudomonadales bacterium]